MSGSAKIEFDLNNDNLEDVVESLRADPKEPQEVVEDSQEVEEQFAEEEVVSQDVEVQDREYTEKELEALKIGWKPPEKFDRDDKVYRDAETFLAMQPEIDKRHDMQKMYEKRINEMTNVLEGLSKKMHATEIKGYEKAIADIDAKRRDALESYDIDKFQELDAEYLRTRDELKAVSQEQAAAKGPTDWERMGEEFAAKHRDWFNNINDPEGIVMTQRIRAYIANIVDSSPNIAPDEAVRRAESAIKYEFPNRFSNPNRSRPPAVSSPKPARVKSGPTVDDLSAFQKQRFEILKSHNKDFTVKEYLEIAKGGSYTFD